MYSKVTISSILIFLLIPKERMAKKLKHGKYGTEAELAFFSRHLGFVNNHYVQGQVFYDVLKIYVELKTGHEVQVGTVPWSSVKELSSFMKIELCRKYLNEPVLRYNKIFLDEEASISIVEMVVEFHYHDVPTILDTFIRCPITTGETKSASYLYMTLVERAEFENEDHYYIFAEDEPGVVVPLMRSKYNYGSLLDDIWASLRGHVWSFADTILSMGEDSII